MSDEKTEDYLNPNTRQDLPFRHWRAASMEATDRAQQRDAGMAPEQDWRAQDVRYQQNEIGGATIRKGDIIFPK